MGIAEAIKNHRIIMCDTAPIIYFIEEHKIFGEIADSFFRTIRDKAEYHAFSSVITLIEVLTQPLKQSRNDIVEKYSDFLLHSPNFHLYPVDAIIAQKAAKLRSKYSIKTPDAIQIAIGIENNATLFLTNDKNLKRVKEITVIVLEDYLE
jgi:predicted nucleic acid-binding protein